MPFFYNKFLLSCYKHTCGRSKRLRPYYVEHTGSRPITEVKQRRAWLVLGWVTAWEHLVLLASFVIDEEEEEEEEQFIHGVPMIFLTEQAKGKEKIYDTWYSQAVTHPSTDQAQHCLTSVIGREPVLSM